MLTLRAAAGLLSRAATVTDLASLAAAAGFDGAPAPLDGDMRRALGIGAEVADAHVAAGPGALRALLLCSRGAAPLRDLLARLAARLATRTPHVLWLLVATEPRGSAVGVAAWRAGRRPPRVSALVADREHVVDSDAETLRALAACGGGADVLTHERWVEILGREALTRRFYRALESHVSSLASSASRGGETERAEIALLYASRLLFLAFLEAKGWLDGDADFLARRFDACMSAGGGYHRRVLLPLFFGTLNTPVRARAPAARAFGRIPFLNGGLFARTPAEHACRGLRFPDEALGALFGDVFARFRFTAREESATWSEAAIDPEMLGRAFESLMASRERRASGAFFTPHELVERVAAAALERAIASTHGDAAARRLLGDGAAEPSEIASLRERIAGLLVLDPACGSGSFLVHALERIADLLRALGDARPTSAVRREVLTRCIFGVDCNPMAVWLCELRLWLSVVIEADAVDPLTVPPLPNLDRNIRLGDSLSGAGFGEVAIAGGAATRRLRARYARATGARKESLGRELDRAERRVAVASLDAAVRAAAAARRELVAAARGRDLFGERHSADPELRRRRLELRARLAELRAERRRVAGGGALAFSFGVHFADVADRRGFDVVLGNPPWVRLHRIPASMRERLRRGFSVFRAAAWEAGAERARAGRGFAAQVDLAALFVEQSLRVVRPGGVVALLLPVKLWRSLAGGGVRRLLATETRVRLLEDYGDAPAAFDASVYPSLLVAERYSLGGGPESPPSIAAAAFRGAGPAIAFRIVPGALSLDASDGSPWLVVPREVREAFDVVRGAGMALVESPLGSPRLGVKCGCNAAFVVRFTGERGGLAEVECEGGRRGLVEPWLLRPVARGEHVRAWRRIAADERILWTHCGEGAPMDRLPPHAAHWLAHWARALAARADVRHDRHWWMLFRTDAARTDRPRVIWADIGRGPRATIVPAGDPVVPLNTCYVVHCPDEEDALALAALLNGPLAAAWLDLLAEPARGDYRRYLGWTMALLPLPRDWSRARAVLAPIAARATGDPCSVSGVDLLEAALEAYRLPRRAAAPLLAWCSR